MEVIKIKGEIIKIESRKIIQEMKQIRNWFSEEINKIDKILGRLNLVKTEDSITNGGMKKGIIITNLIEIKRLIMK